MESTPSPDPTREQQALRSRLFWFVAGAGVNYLLIAMPFKWLRFHAGLSVSVSAGLSMAASSIFFFCWNYFLNFRTDARKRDALWRYLSAVALMWLLSSTLLSVLKHLHAQLNFLKLDLDVIATQFFLAGIKFPLYHKWAFPVKSTRLREEEFPRPNSSPP